MLGLEGKWCREDRVNCENVMGSTILESGPAIVRNLPGPTTQTLKRHPVTMVAVRFLNSTLLYWPKEKPAGSSRLEELWGRALCPALSGQRPADSSSRLPGSRRARRRHFRAGG